MIKTMMITMMVMMATIKVVERDDYDSDHGGSNKKVDDDDFLMSGLGMISEALAFACNACAGLPSVIL